MKKIKNMRTNTKRFRVRKGQGNRIGNFIKKWLAIAKREEGSKSTTRPHTILKSTKGRNLNNK